MKQMSEEFPMQLPEEFLWKIMEAVVNELRGILTNMAWVEAGGGSNRSS